MGILDNWRSRPATRATSTGEVRAPQAATTPVAWQAVNRPMIPDWDAGNAISRGYYSSVFVYRCAQVRAQAVAGLPIRIGPDPDKPEDFNARHPLVRVLTGNPAVGWRTLATHASAGYDITGRFAWELELAKDRGRIPVRVWPLVAQYLDPVPTREGADDYWARFEYRVAAQTDNVKKLDREQVLYAWRPRLDDPRQPESLLQAQRMNVSVAVMLDRYNYSFLLNDARPASVVVMQAFEESEQFDAFKRQYLGQHQGVANAGKPIFVEAQGTDDGAPVDAGKWLDIKQLGLSQKDAQAIQMMKEEIRAICVGFGVPMSMLGDSSDRTFSNADQEAKNFWQGTMLPHLADLADHINRELAPRFGDDKVWFDTSGIEALKRPRRFAGVDLGPLLGQVVTVNEARADFGLPPMPDGDQLAPAAAGPPDVPDVPALAVEPAVPSSPTAGAPARAGDTSEQRAPDITTTVVPDPEPVDHEARRSRIYVRVDAQVRTLEALWARQLAAMFSAQERAVLDRLKDRRGKQMLRDANPDTRQVDITRLFDPEFWKTRMAEIVTGLLETVVGVGATRVADALDIDFDLNGPTAQDFILTRATRLAEHVTDTTMTAIREQLSEGVGAGEGVDPLAGRVRSVFADAKGQRAEMIARTEVIGSYNGAATLAAESAPISLSAGKEWIATRDKRTRPHHRELDGKVVGVREPFTVGSARLGYPGDPAGPVGELANCRCTIAFLDATEMAERHARSRVEVRAANHILALVAAKVLPLDRVATALEVAA